jgi:hypothetical protein
MLFFLAFFSLRHHLKVIKHELSYGPLDFNFQNNNNQDEMLEAQSGVGEPTTQPTAPTPHGQYPARTSTPSWVH